MASSSRSSVWLRLLRIIFLFNTPVKQSFFRLSMVTLHLWACFYHWLITSKGCRGNWSFPDHFVFLLFFTYIIRYIGYWFKFSGTIILKTVYNISFRHRKIPGSIWYKATDWAFWWSFRQGQSHRQIEGFHQKFGILSLPTSLIL